MATPNWLPAIIDRLRTLTVAGDVRFTQKALRELALLELGFDETDVCEILAGLQESDFRSRVVSTITQEYLYIFALHVADIEIYLKVAVRAHCVVISFHEDVKDGN